jgi:GNAT superfamily N-acetyltransferase
VNVDVVDALLTDAEEILRMRRKAEDWLAARGIEQWRPGAVGPAAIADQLQRGEWHVVRRASGLCAGLRLLWSDPSLWQGDDRFAAYVHGMMIDRIHAGQGLGTGLLRWADEQALAASAPFVRLDCVESNERLRAYYEAQEFTVVGRRDFDGPWPSVVLLQKPTLRRR